MAATDTKLSQITSQQSNPADADRIHLIHQVAGVWYDYYVTIATLRELFAGTGKLKIEQVALIGGVPSEYVPDQYERIIGFTFHPDISGTDTIKVGTTLDDDYYVEETTQLDSIVSIYMNSSNTTLRTLVFTTSTSEVVYVNVLSILNL